MCAFSWLIKDTISTEYVHEKESFKIMSIRINRFRLEQNYVLDFYVSSIVKLQHEKNVP